MNATNVEDTPEGQSASTRNEYVAILYFHGMGTPRRYEEISMIADALDQFVEKQDPDSIGSLRHQRVSLEPSRVHPDSDDIAFVRFRRRIRRFGDRSVIGGRFRIYEAYWSPTTAGGYGSVRVFTWLASRVASPIRALWLHHWRAHQRLKLATLYRIYASNWAAQFRGTLEHLETYYREFENWPARRSFPRGTFREFCTYIERDPKSSLQDPNQLIHIAHLWRRLFVINQLLLLSGCATFLLAALESFAIILFLFTRWLDEFGIHPQFSKTFELNWPLHVDIGWLIIFSSICIGAIVSANHYLSKFWADVMFWSVQKEKDVRYAKRRDILRSGIQTLVHVLRDPLCKRIVVIGHSLGSAIAYECLAELGRKFRARPAPSDRDIELNRLGIISHLITIGSPIDRLHYFFELHDSKYHRYNRISERLRGDTRDPPFTLPDGSAIEWINIWDNADPISGPLYSPRRRTPNQSAIDDVKVASTHRPNFLTAHNSYWFGIAAMRRIFWPIITGRAPPSSADNQNFVLAYWDRYSRVVCWALIGLLPWGVLFLAVAMTVRSERWVYTFLGVLLVAVGILIFCHIIGTLLDRQRPLRVDGTPSVGT